MLQEWRTKVDLKAFTLALNEHPDIHEAAAEAKEESENPAVGLAALFGAQQ